MSLINDALNKVQRQRGEKLTVDALSRYGSTPQIALPKTGGRLPAAVWVLINASVLVVVLVAYHFLFRDSPANVARTPGSPVSAAPSNPARYATSPTSAPAEPVVTPVEDSALSTPPSRFRDASSSSAGGTSDTPPATEPAYDLAGMTVVGKGTLLSIIRRSDQRSFWVPIGKTVGEVTAISYNADADTAVIRVHGQFITIGMRDGSVFFTPVTPQK